MISYPWLINQPHTITAHQKGVKTMNRKNIFAINVKRQTANIRNYANANKFLHCIIVEGEEAKQAKLEELKNAGVEIDSIFNGIGEKIKF